MFLHEVFQKLSTRSVHLGAFGWVYLHICTYVFKFLSLQSIKPFHDAFVVKYCRNNWSNC